MNAKTSKLQRMHVQAAALRAAVTSRDPTSDALAPYAGLPIVAQLTAARDRAATAANALAKEREAHADTKARLDAVLAAVAAELPKGTIP